MDSRTSRKAERHSMDIEQTIEHLFMLHELDNWKYRRNDRLTSTAGRCCRLSKTIELAGWFIDNNNDDEIRLTILHEIAHALTPGHGHDSVWRRKCIALGGNGETYYNRGDRQVINPNSDKPRRRSTKVYTLECQGCGYTGGRYRRRMNNYRHKRCGGDLISIEI